MITNPIYDVTLFDCPKFRMLDFGDCPRARNIKDDGAFEPTSMRLWCHLARTASSILDIGAHVGVYSLAAAMLRPDLTVQAFEPNPFAYTRLREHVRLNELQGRIEEHHYALSDTLGIAPFTWARKPNQPISSGGAIGIAAPHESVETYPVMMTTLDDCMPGMDFGPRPLVKIDVEGGEVEVFKGASKLLAAKPDIILECFDADKAAAIRSMLPEGYKAHTIYEKANHIGLGGPLRHMSTKGEDFNQFLTMRPIPTL